MLSGPYAGFSGTDPPASFQQAVSDYNAGKYALALSEFKLFEATYPDNALVHYYSALCDQCLGYVEQAKKEFDWVTKMVTRVLLPLAEKGLQQLSQIRTQPSRVETPRNQ